MNLGSHRRHTPGWFSEGYSRGLTKAGRYTPNMGGTTDWTGESDWIKKKRKREHEMSISLHSASQPVKMWKVQPCTSTLKALSYLYCRDYGFPREPFSSPEGVSVLCFVTALREVTMAALRTRLLCIGERESSITQENGAGLKELMESSWIWFYKPIK